ncbi:hypothetical protein CcI49_23030 [Frankia sp. CcI49]|uniref:hypothetical protein n=1 Tax=unclassified Frankia TaxID=2632575 RepID=UPI0006CA557C|nr:MULTISPECIES: hypothetical protein [unclassified Frankia]KPM55807.1 hypothetical protein ACG83_11080 [Frankia sp. R43]ONH58332.1 hypothetical protein CcI49_23030 [Frankia sp. CcI49]
MATRAANVGQDRVPPGLARILAPLDAYDGEEPFGAVTAARLLDVEPRTVTSWATARQLSGLLLSRSIGWRFTVVDLREFLTRRYYRAN